MWEQFGIKAVFGLIGSGFAFMYGGWSFLIIFLMILQGLDLFTGLLSGFVRRELSSKVGRAGGARKVMMWVWVGIAHLLDIFFKETSTQFLEIQIDYPIQTIALVFFIGTELVSILENSDKLNVKVPNFLRSLFTRLQQNADKGDNNEGK